MRSRAWQGAVVVAAAGVAAAVAWRGGEQRPSAPAVRAPVAPPASGPIAVASTAPATAGALARVAGSSRDGVSGRPIDGATLTFAGAADREVTTGADGRYAVDLPPGRYRLVARAVGFAAAGVDALVVAPGAVAGGVDLELMPNARIAGRVVDGRGDPVADATVRCAAGECAAATSADGRFAIDVPPGRATLRAAAGDRVSRDFAVRGIEPGAEIDGVELVVDRPARIAGTVVDRRGAPVARGAVAAWRGGAVVGRAEVAGGAFSLAGLPAGTVALVASAPGHGPSAPRAVDLSPGEEARVALVLAAPARIAGRVVDPAGHPVAGARVVAVAPAPAASRGEAAAARGAPADAPITPVAEAESGADGRYVLQDLGAGPYDLQAVRAGWAPGRRARVAAPADGIDLALQPGGGVAGAVSAAGQPIAEFTVDLAPLSRYGGGPVGAARAVRFVAPDGHYRVDGLEPGRYELAVSAAGFGTVVRPQLVVAPAAFADGSVELVAEATIAGRVTDAATGRPLAGAEVAVAGRAVECGVHAAADGAYRIDGVAPGRYDVRARHPGYVDRVQRGVDVVAGGVHEVDFALDRDDDAVDRAGIGAALAWRGDALAVVGVVPHAPADVAGLRSGDRIVAIDGVPTARQGGGASIDDVRGAAGTVVRVRVRRAGNPPFELALVRAPVRDPGGE